MFILKFNKTLDSNCASPLQTGVNNYLQTRGIISVIFRTQENDLDSATTFNTDSALWSTLRFDFRPLYSSTSFKHFI